MRLKYVTILMHKRDELHFSRLYLHQCVSYTACHAHCTGCDSYSTREITVGKLSVWCHFAVSPIPHPPDCCPRTISSCPKEGHPHELGFHQKPVLNEHRAWVLCLPACQPSLNISFESLAISAGYDGRKWIQSFWVWSVFMTINNWWRK